MDAVEPDSGISGTLWRAVGGGFSAATAGFGAGFGAGSGGGTAARGLAFGHGAPYYDNNNDGFRKRYVRPGGGSAASGAVLVFGVDIPG